MNVQEKSGGDSNICVLHSLNGDTIQTWGHDLELVFSDKGIQVLLPQFPIREKSSYEKFDKLMSKYLEKGMVNGDTVIVAHSISNPYFIRFAREHKFVPKAYIAVAPGAVYEYPSTRKDYIVAVKKQAYLQKADLQYAKKSLKNKYCLYSDEDDNNIEKFTRFISDIGANGIHLDGYNHFDGYHRIYKIPELNELLFTLI